MELKGAAALVTGGSRGLGAALGRALAARGARVVLAARSRSRLDEIVGEIRAAGGEAHSLVSNLADREAIHPLAGAASALLGPLDLLIHNASELGPLPMRELADTECEDLAHVLETNLLGPFRLTQALVGGMLLRGRGLVAAITSDAAVVGYPRWGAYGVSKAALEQLTRTWAAELAGSGVRFLSLDPGEMDTLMHAQAMPEADRSILPRPEAVASRIVELLARAESFESGARVEVAAWAQARA